MNGTHIIEAVRESDDGERIVFVIKKESESLGTRVAARPVKIKPHNLVRLYSEQRIVVDFTDIPAISSSFADEVSGKLFLEFSPLAFMQRLEVLNTTDRGSYLRRFEVGGLEI